MKRTKHLSFILIIIILLSLLFCIKLSIKKYKDNYIFDYKYEEIKLKQIEIKFPYFNYRKLDKKIKNIITKQFADVKGKVVTKTAIINNKYLSLLFKVEEENQPIDYQSYLFDLNNAQRIPINKIIKKNKYKKFEEIIIKNLYTKYPKFIVDGISNSKKGKRSFLVKENEIEFYYTGYEINPAVVEEIYLKINFNDLQEVLNFDFKPDKNYQNENIYRIDNNKKLVVFGFDDGPSKNSTPQMLDVLKANHVHATFFMVGYRMQNNPDIVKRAFDEGNDVASHSYSHLNLTKLSIDDLNFQINQTNAIFKSITGNDIKYVRPPYGNVNSFVKDNVNFPFITWNIDPRDWEKRDAIQISNYILENVFDGSFFVMHDIYDSTVEAMKIVLPELYARGYQVVSFEEALTITNKEILPHNVYKNFK